MLGQMMQVGFYGHVRQYKNIQAEIDANIKRVIESVRAFTADQVARDHEAHASKDVRVPSINCTSIKRNPVSRWHQFSPAPNQLDRW